MKPRVAIPDPCSYDREYSRRSLTPYVQAVIDSGGEPVVLNLNLSPDQLAGEISHCQAVLLPGSKADVEPQKFNQPRHPRSAQADPLRDAADELLLQDAYNLRKPILGICYGLQSLNVWRTGTLVQHIESEIDHSPRDPVKAAHQVTVEPGSLLARSLGLPDQPESHLPTTPRGAQAPPDLVPVNSSHHQAAELVGDGLRAVAHCPQDHVIEALEGTNPAHFVLAVQWHPERTFAGDEHSRRLFQAFISAASERSKIPADHVVTRQD